MNRMTYETKCIEDNSVLVSFSFVGAGAADGTVPTSHSHTTKSAVRGGVGLFVVTFVDKVRFPTTLMAYQPCVIGTNGKKAFITAQDPVAGTITIQVKDNTDAAVDPAATDQVFLAMRYRNSKVKYGGAA